jgi:hypothetical protein
MIYDREIPPENIRLFEEKKRYDNSKSISNNKKGIYTITCICGKTETVCGKKKYYDFLRNRGWKRKFPRWKYVYYLCPECAAEEMKKIEAKAVELFDMKCFGFAEIVQVLLSRATKENRKIIRDAIIKAHSEEYFNKNVIHRFYQHKRIISYKPKKNSNTLINFLKQKKMERLR